MAIFLNEGDVGQAADLVGFPHLLVCMGYVALTADRMYGLHMDTTMQEHQAKAFPALWQFMRAKGAGPIVALYGCCNRHQRYKRLASDAARLAARTAEMGVMAHALGDYHGPARGFDTSIIAPLDGTYVEYHPNYPQGRCRIFYKRHEKMNYTNSDHTQAHDHNPDQSWVSYYTGRTRDVDVETVAAAGKKSLFHKGTLHEVDYALRLDQVQV
jgi:hypothetical protein